MSINPYDFYAENGLHRIYNNHALHVLDKGINVPQPALGIGFAELTAPVPLTVSMTPILKMPDVAPVASVEDTFTKTKGGGLRIESFSQTGYYGESLGGF